MPEAVMKKEIAKLLRELFSIQELARFYPAHIIKGDRNFFYPILDYFSKAEQDNMLSEFWEFDRKLIDEKYLKSSRKARINSSKTATTSHKSQFCEILPKSI